LQRMESGELKPLRHTIYPLSESKRVFEQMQKAQHIGKLVLAPAVFSGAAVTDAGSYLITGGLGGLGLATAQWLVGQGVRHVVLNGRSAPTQPAEVVIAELRAAGAEVEVMLGDVADANTVEHILQQIETELPPLKGVFHSVGVLRDAAVLNQDWESFAAVLRPKVLGAWHLDRLTANLDLDLFVLYSSSAGLLGNRGQANHAAANVFLDQLAWDRRRRGLPAQTINWGAWSQIGAAAQHQGRMERQLAQAGLGWIEPARGIESLARILADGATQVGVMPVDWARFVQQTTTGMSPFISELVTTVIHPRRIGG
ncbi:MAG: SDR family NAD(P)-dependent oxidoreductase, partial [Delftia sp.]|nr:SDR family NAD(P)-dependent oxidoreductase [Delftia sp.]